MCTIWDIRYFISTSGSSQLSLMFQSPDKRQCIDQSSSVARHRMHRYSRWNFIAILCTSWFKIYLRFQAAIFNVLPTLTSSCFSIRPTMLFDAKDMRIPLNFHMFNLQCQLGSSVHGLMSAILIFSCTRIEFCTGRCCYQQRELQQQTQQRWICLLSWFTPFDSMVTKFITFSPKNHQHHIYFRWRNSITGWTI